MNHYADSSFLVSCYLLDANTPLAKAYLSRTSAPLAWTALHALEVRNAFELGVFRGLLTTADAAAAWANLESDLKSGRLFRTTVKWPAALRRAARLSERHSATTGTRSLDILHVAAAKSVRAVEFISFNAVSFTDDTSPDTHRSRRRNVSIHASVIREKRLDWYYEILKLFPGFRDELKSTQILESYKNLPRAKQQTIWNTLKDVHIHVTDALPIEARALRSQAIVDGARRFLRHDSRLTAI